MGMCRQILTSNRLEGLLCHSADQTVVWTDIQIALKQLIISLVDHRRLISNDFDNESFVIYAAKIGQKKKQFKDGRFQHFQPFFLH